MGYYTVAECQIIPDTKKGQPLAWLPLDYVLCAFFLCHFRQFWKNPLWNSTFVWSFSSF